MDIYKKYIYKLRELSLKEPYIILKDDIAPKLKHYIRILVDVKFEDGSYELYYGEIKTIVNSFNIHWTEVMDDAIKEADRCSHCMNLEELLKMADRTTFLHKVKQTDFESQFLPFNTSFEEQMYNEILEKHKDFMQRLEEMLEGIKKLNNQEKVDAFAKAHFNKSLKKKNEIFVFTYNYISYHLSLFIGRIRVSIEEIFNRLRNNLRAMQEQSEANVSNLFVQLYEKNKEHLVLFRQDIRPSVELAEVQRSMDIIRDKIDDFKYIPMQRLQDEYKYWEDRIREFVKIETSMKRIQEEENRILEQEKLFHSMKDSSIPAPKLKCWDHMGEKFKEKLQEIDVMKMNAANALHTFFGARGPNRILYSDNIGNYYVDDYGHQCYVFDSGLNVFHSNCEGDFVEVTDKNNHFYDELGRFYINKDNPKEKIYQAAPCSSCYRIEKGLFVKISKDCGHSENGNKECKMLIKDPNDVVILPKVAPVNVKGTLNPEVVRYLWDSFGHILPDVLQEIGEIKPKNPIHNLAHSLLAHKYRRTEEVMKYKKQEADLYRRKIYKDRIQVKFFNIVADDSSANASATYKAWKQKQTKPRKTDESDDVEKFAYNAYATQNDFVRSLEFYDI